MLPSSILHTAQLDCTNVCFHQIPQTISFSIPGLGMEAADTRVGLIIEIYGRINILSCSHTARAAVMMPGAHVSAVWAMLACYHAPCSMLHVMMLAHICIIADIYLTVATAVANNQPAQWH